LQLERENKLVICLELTNLIWMRVAWTQSLSAWMVVSCPFPQLEQIGETPTFHLLLWMLV